MDKEHKKPKIVIHLEGGLVQFVYGDSPVDVLIMDGDICPGTPYHDLNGDKGEAVFHFDNPSCDKKEATWVRKLFKEVQTNG